MLARSRDKLDMATKLATKRSGARGREARRDQIICEKEYSELSAKDPQTAVTGDDANTMVSEVFEKLELIDVGEMQAKAKKILLGIGFTKEQIESPVSLFSGGWRMKIALAKSLFMDPNILLLDEPSKFHHSQSFSFADNLPNFSQPFGFACHSVVTRVSAKRN